MRTTPMPPRPAAVAMAATVSGVENIGSEPARGLLRTDDDRLDRRVPDPPGAGAFFGDGQMHDAPLVRVERANLLWRPCAQGLGREEPRHLLQLVVLVATEVLAVVQHAPFLSELPAERRADDVLDGLQ